MTEQTLEATKPEVKKVKKVAPKKEEPQYATVEDFNKLTTLMGQLVETVAGLKTATATPSDIKNEKEVTRADPDHAPMNPAWEDKAREILGEVVDHCFVVYPKGGGTIFTIVIKPEFSNATPQYLEMYKMDRRTREIGSEGIAGVETLAKLVKQNLSRNRATN